MKPTLPIRHVFVAGFSREADGTLTLAFEPREFRNEVAAIRFAKMLEEQHVGVIAWSRNAQGARVALYSHGEVPEME